MYDRIADLYKDDLEIFPYAKKMQIERNINIYNLLTLEKDIKFKKLKKQIRKYIMLNKEEVKNSTIITEKTKLMVYGILYMRFIYDLIYKIYFNKKYN